MYVLYCLLYVRLETNLRTHSVLVFIFAVVLLVLLLGGGWGGGGGGWAEASWLLRHCSTQLAQHSALLLALLLLIVLGVRVMARSREDELLELAHAKL